MNKEDKTSVGSRVGSSKSTVTRERERGLRKTKNGWGLKAESLPTDEPGISKLQKKENQILIKLIL